MVEFIIQTLVVASIVGAVDWVLTTDRKSAPTVRGERTLYTVSRRIHVTTLISAAICAVLAVSYYQNGNSVKEWLLTCVFGSFAVLGVYISTGSVTTDKNGVTKKVFWHTTGMKWTEITEVLLLQRDGGAIRLKAGTRKLTVDMRFVGRDHLLEEITSFTGLLPKRVSMEDEGKSR